VHANPLLRRTGIHSAHAIRSIQSAAASLGAPAVDFDDWHKAYLAISIKISIEALLDAEDSELILVADRVRVLYW
jgi:hypothetical protein